VKRSRTVILYNGLTNTVETYRVYPGGLRELVKSAPEITSGTTKFLREDGVYATPPGGSGGNAYFPSGW